MYIDNRGRYCSFSASWKKHTNRSLPRMVHSVKSLGVNAICIKHERYEDSGSTDNISPKVYDKSMKKLYRSRTDKKIAGVCGGLAEYFGIDATIVRIIAFALLLPGWLPGFLPYVIMWVIVPQKPNIAVE